MKPNVFLYLSYNRDLSHTLHLLFYNQFHNILRLFHDLPDFPFTTSETMCDYYLKTWYIRVAERLKT